MQAISSDILSLINSPQQQENSSDDLGQADFLELMVTQLQNTHLNHFKAVSLLANLHNLVLFRVLQN